MYVCAYTKINVMIIVNFLVFCGTLFKNHLKSLIYIYITGPLMSVLLFKPYRLRDRLT